MNKLSLLLITSLLFGTAYNPNNFPDFMMMRNNKQIVSSSVNGKSTGMQELVNEFSLYATLPGFGI
jgi:hypothetical protein